MLGLILHVISYTTCLCRRVLFEGGLEGGEKEWREKEGGKEEKGEGKREEGKGREGRGVIVYHSVWQVQVHVHMYMYIWHITPNSHMYILAQ